MDLQPQHNDAHNYLSYVPPVATNRFIIPSIYSLYYCFKATLFHHSLSVYSHIIACRRHYKFRYIMHLLSRLSLNHGSIKLLPIFPLAIVIYKQHYYRICMRTDAWIIEFESLGLLYVCYQSRKIYIDPLYLDLQLQRRKRVVYVSNLNAL